jgi:cytochrome c554/c'-like protein
MAQSNIQCSTARTGWASRLTRVAMWTLLVETVTGLAIRFAPFHPAVEWSVLVHTAIGVLTLVPLAWYCARHWSDYRRQAVSDVVFLGYVAVAALLVCALSGAVVTVQALFGTRSSMLWRNIHLISTFAVLAATLPHLALSLYRRWLAASPAASRTLLIYGGGGLAVALAGIVALPFLYSGSRYVNKFPSDYHFLYGKDRPFAPSLARTVTNGAFDARSLAGSESCGTSGCHDEILAEWKPSAHRYAAMDTVFQGIQKVMAEQNGPESTRYCAGCHDPISLFSGSKNIFTEKLTNAQGYHEGVSCLACHAIRKTDIQGNANYVVIQPREYLWQWATSGPARIARDFLIRSYPEEHNRLSKRLFKTPEYCAACHKQFIDQEVNRVGWVQLQNQYDNWAASHWNRKGDTRKTVECRECHMPLVSSKDPAAGDVLDYNRTERDGKHRSHRFLAANNLMPALLKLEGWQRHTQLTEQWLKGKLSVPEIRDKWAEGAIVTVRLEHPAEVAPGEKIPIRVILTSNKVGHDFPTGPLDMIQSWLEIQITDDKGGVLFASGRRDQKNFIEPGTFLFKAEPVDQYGNLIDRHNLWEMVGVRYRRSLFPGYSDTVEYAAMCPSGVASGKSASPADSWRRRQDFLLPEQQRPGSVHIRAVLHYRKIDQFLLNYVLGEHTGITAPAVDLAEARGTVQIRAPQKPQATHLAGNLNGR